MTQPLTPAELIAAFAEQNGPVALKPTTTSTDPFFAYDRPETHGVHAEQVQVPMRDGVHLSGELHRPANPDGTPAAGPFPGIVYEFNGYNSVPFFAAGAHHYVTRGYAVLVCNVRGTGGSPGTVDPFGLQEQNDNVDLIEWLAAQPFSTGKIGQMGVSYGGHNTMLAVVNQAPHLVTAIAAQSFSDWYDNTLYRGGIPNAQIREWQRNTAPHTLETYPEHPLFDTYWQERSVKMRWDKVNIPVLDVGGWLDAYRVGMVENYLSNPDLFWMVAGPWQHGMMPGQIEDIAAAGYLAWWDYWLQDDLAGLLPQVKVTSYEMPNHGWQQYTAWPPEQSQTTTWAMTSTGRLRRNGAQGGNGLAEAASYMVFDARPPKESPDAPAQDSPSGRLVFHTPHLEFDEVIAGAVEVSVRVAFSASDGHIAAILEDVAPDGTATRITNGWLKASHRDGDEEPAPVEPDTAYHLLVALWPAHHRVTAGHLLRLTISSSDYPQIDDTASPGTVTLQVGGDSCELRYGVIA
ncbi:CocE/NonD family hydrolase [Streptomyces sp. NPDC059743]|uniref:CocE/NonD family hydrolase n=1 Tax=Streptomyces sp. NPDC059743 TaxID=3346928 RepID=UPI00364FDF15